MTIICNNEKLHAHIYSKPYHYESGKQGSWPTSFRTNMMESL